MLHLSVLIETMRREGYELSVGKPHVILHENDGVTEEPFESLVVEVPHDKLGPVMELVGARRGQLVEMTARGDYTYVVFSIPARGLIGLRTRLLNATQGTAIIHHRFEALSRRWKATSPAAPTACWSRWSPARSWPSGSTRCKSGPKCSSRPGDEVYEGMIVGENSRTEDMAVNPTKEKKLTNMRASGSDENILLKPPRMMSLEMALEYIEEDELVEVTPTKIRLRKKVLKETDRRKKVAAVTVGRPYSQTTSRSRRRRAVRLRRQWCNTHSLREPNLRRRGRAVRRRSPRRSCRARRRRRVRPGGGRLRTGGTPHCERNRRGPRCVGLRAVELHAVNGRQAVPHVPRECGASFVHVFMAA